MAESISALTTLGVPRSTRKGEPAMQSTLLTVDAGPDFAGWAGTSHGRMICVAPHEIETSEEVRRSMREIVKRAGGDCEGCRNCWLGT